MVVTIEQPATAHEARARRRLETLKHPEQPVNRAPRRPRSALVNGHHQESSVPPLTRHRQWRSVRLPIRQVRVHTLQQCRGARLAQRCVAAEHPHARGIRERLEWNDWHVELV